MFELVGPVVLSIVAFGIVAFLLLAAVLLRRVVATNEVHIVQSSKKTTSYGKDTTHGNTYYEWPSWVPVFGITKIILPVSVFDLDLVSYEAYDKGRLPFVVDVKAFFRIADSNMAAQRVASFSELHNQLKAIVQGAVRTILASSDIEEIMQGRSTFGEQFTKEVSCQLKAWGVETVKNIELMDIRDGNGSKVIHNIMEKKKSHIEMESRTEVAKNHKMAQIAEIDAQREVELQNQEAEQQVGLRKVDVQQKIQIATQTSIQLVKEEEKLTKEKEMQVIKVGQIRKAEIDKESAIITADQEKAITIIEADAKLSARTKEAEGLLAYQTREAEGVKLIGEAKADAEKAMLLAPVDSQIKLAQEIGGNKEYQQYLITIEQIKANQAVGIEQAKALAVADIKVIASAGTTSSGIKSVMDVFSANGGTQIGALLEGLANTETGKAIVDRIVGTSV